MELHLPNNETLNVTPEDESYRITRIMGENSVTLKWKRTEFVEIPTGTYITFRGRRYTLYSPENFKKRGKRIFEYTLLLETYQAIARRFYVKDATGKTKFNFTGTPRDLLDLFVWNMNQRDSGWTRGSYIMAEPKLIAFDGNTVIEGVQMGADAFGTEFSFDDKVISFGKVEFNKAAPLALSYGRGHGFLPGVGRENFSDATAFEILNVQGGDRNIDASKYGNDVLLLPKSQTIGYDGSKFSDEAGFVPANARYYVTDASGLTVRRSDKALSTYAEACFDGTKIYPTIAHTILKVETSTETIDDEEQTVYDIIVDAVEALDYRDCQIAGEAPTVIFQSGMLTGREFSLATKADGTLDIEKYSENGSFVGWRLKLCNDEQDGYIMPGGSFVPMVDGTVKIFGIQLPDAYICDNASKTGASWQMFRDAVRYMFDHEDPKFTFSGELDGVYSKANWTTVGPKIVPGGYVQFSDTQFLPDGALIRIIGIREPLNNPYSPTLELSNGAVHGSFASQMAALENTENKIEAAKDDTIAYTRRSWRAAKETQSLLEKALLQEFTTTISPISINTMQMLVGSESLQYGWIQSLTNDTIVDHRLSLDSNGNLVCPAGYIKHYEMGITEVQPNKAVTSFMRWSVSAATLAFTDENEAYYLYIKAQQLNAAGTGTATFVLSDEPIGLEDVSGYWHFLYATIGSVMDGERSIFTCNGFTEIGPGRIAAYKFISPDGQQFIDFLNKSFRIGNASNFLGWNLNNDQILRLKGTMVQSAGGTDEFIIPCFRGAYLASTEYYYGDEVTYNGETWLHIGPTATTGTAPEEGAVWTKRAAKGNSGAFKSIVFKRSVSEPTKPGNNEGSYESPVPTGWSDGIPTPGSGQTSETQVWMTTRIFVAGGGSGQQASWTDVQPLTDTADIDYEFSAVETNPGTPATSPSNWHNTASSSDIWMAVRKASNGVWGAWDVNKIKGEKGDSGSGNVAIYTWAQSDSTAPTVPTSKAYPPASTSAWKKSAPSRPTGDGYYLWMSTGSLNPQTGNVDAWSTPVRISGDQGTAGEDAKEREWIYKLASSNPGAPTNPQDRTVDDYIPTGWSDNPSGVTDTDKTEWASWRDFNKTTQQWGDFQTPIIWSHYGERGTDGDGVEYVYVRTKSNIVPSVYGDDSTYTDSYGNTYIADDHRPRVAVSSSYAIYGNTHYASSGQNTISGKHVAECTDDPVGVTSTWRYEWVLKRTKSAPDANGVRSWEPYSGSMSLWAYYSKDGAVGADGKSMRGISEWSSIGYCGNSQTPYQGKGDTTGEYYDIVSYRIPSESSSLYYQCLYNSVTVEGTTHYATDPPATKSGSQVTYNPCWELMNNYENIATKAMAVDKAVINDLTAGVVRVKELTTEGERIEVKGNSMVVRDTESDHVTAQINSNELDTSSGGGTSNVSVSSGSATSSDVTAAVNLMGGNNTLEILRAANLVQIPLVRATISTSPASPAPTRFFVRIYALSGTTQILIADNDVYTTMTSCDIPAIACSLPVGTWKIMYEFSIDTLDEGQTMTASITIPNSGKIQRTYYAALNRTDLAGNGFQTIWTPQGGGATHGFRATGNGAKVIRGSAEMEALGGGALDSLTALKNIVLCTNYPQSGEDGTLYLKITPVQS